MAEQDRAGEADRFAHGTGSTEKHEAERDSFRPGETSGGVPQSIEATTAALGDMEPSAGSGGAGRTDDDRDA